MNRRRVCVQFGEGTSYLETEYLRARLKTDRYLEISTPSVEATVAAIRTIDAHDLDIVQGAEGPPPNAILTCVKDVVTVDGIIEFTNNLVDRLMSEIDGGVCLVFLPSQAIAERAATAFPVSAPQGRPQVYIFSQQHVPLYKRPCFVFGGPNMDEHFHEPDVHHVVDSCRIYRKLDSPFDFTLGFISKARWMGRRRRAWHTYEMLCEERDIAVTEFTKHSDLWDAVLDRAPSAIDAALVYAMLSSCTTDKLPRSDFTLSRKDLSSVIKERFGNVYPFSRHAIEWPLAWQISRDVLQRGVALSHDTIATQTRCYRSAMTLSPGSTYCFARVFGNHVKGILPVEAPPIQILTEEIHCTGIRGIEPIKHRCSHLRLSVTHYLNGPRLVVKYLADHAADVDCLKDIINAIRQASKAHCLTWHIAPGVSLRLSAGFTIQSIEKHDSGIAALFSSPPHPHMLGLLTDNRGWFRDSHTFIFKTRGMYLDFVDIMYANAVAGRRRCLFTNTRIDVLQYRHMVDVTWYDGKSTCVAIIDGKHTFQTEPEWDEQDAAEIFGVPEDAVRIQRIVQRVSRTLPGLPANVFIDRSELRMRCSVRLQGLTTLQVRKLQKELPQFDNRVNQPVRAKVTSTIIGHGYGRPSKDVTSVNLWEWDAAKLGPLAKRFDSIDSHAHTTFLMGGEVNSKRNAGDTSDFTCAICCEPRQCRHHMAVCGCGDACIQCIQTHVATQMQDFREVITCPCCGDAMHIADIHAFADPNAVASYVGVLSKVLATRFPDLITSCPGDCGSISSCSPAMSTIFDCPTCMTKWCLQCREKEHVGFCVSKRQDDWMELLQEAAKAGLKSCPSCLTPYDKDNQCSHVKCEAPGCQTHWCFKCQVAFSSSVVSDDARVRVLETHGMSVRVEVVPGSWKPMGNVPEPSRPIFMEAKSLDAYRTADKNDEYFFPTYIYDHINACGATPQAN